jgi:hypothetical protein
VLSGGPELDDSVFDHLNKVAECDRAEGLEGLADIDRLVQELWYIYRAESFDPFCSKWHAVFEYAEREAKNSFFGDLLREARSPRRDPKHLDAVSDLATLCPTPRSPS